MKFLAIKIPMVLWALHLVGCIGGLPIPPERVRRENPEVYLKIIADLRKMGVTDDKLRAYGFKDPLPPVVEDPGKNPVSANSLSRAPRR